MRTHDSASRAAPIHARRPAASARVGRDGGPGIGPHPPVDRGSLLYLQRAAGNASVTAMLAGRSPSPFRRVTGSARGRPLEAPVRDFMESRLGVDLGDVRVHTYPAASESARSVDAHAYTMGTDVVFRADRYAPHTDAGKRMLAHELMHVLQQKAGPVEGTAGPDGVAVSDPSDRFEQEADRVARRVVESGPRDAGPPGAAPGAARGRAGPDGGPGVAAVQRKKKRKDEPDEEDQRS